MVLEDEHGEVAQRGTRQVTPRSGRVKIGADRDTASRTVEAVPSEASIGWCRSFWSFRPPVPTSYSDACRSRPPPWRSSTPPSSRTVRATPAAGPSRSWMDSVAFGPSRGPSPRPFGSGATNSSPSRCRPPYTRRTAPPSPMRSRPSPRANGRDARSRYASFSTSATTASSVSCWHPTPRCGSARSPRT